MQRKSDTFMTCLFWISGIIILLILVWFLFTILSKGLPVLNLHFLTAPASEIEEGSGVGAQFFNTLYILILSMLFVVPIGLGAGIYLAEFSKDNFITKAIRICVECLASVPSIVFGLFGMIIFVIYFKWSFCILAGAASIALLNLPTVIRVTEEAIRSVPYSYREASYAMGATQWQTIVRVVLPASISSILTGINLAVGRAVGESAVLIFTSGTGVSTNIPDLNPMSVGATLSVYLYYVRTISLVPDAEKIAAGTAALLIIIVLIFNAIFNTFSSYIKRKYLGNN